MPGLKNKSNRAVIQRVSLMTLFFCLCSSLAFAAKPTIGTISPASGSTTPDVAKTFTATYADSDGWTNLKEAYLLVSTSSTALTNTSYLYYNQDTNLLYLRDDANTAWLGGYAPTSANTIENAQVKVNCGSTTVSGSGTSLSVNWNITFKSVFSGKTYGLYLYIKDDTGGYAGWSRKGSYTINRPPQIGSITPSSGTGKAETAQIFTTTYTDPDSWQNIQYVYFLLSSSVYTTTNTLYAYYNQNTNLLYLRNDANTAWLGGFAPGSSNVIENSFVRLDCSKTTVSGNNATLTVNWSVATKALFTGSKNTYLYVRDDLNAYQNWTQKGTWNITNQPPVAGSISPASGFSVPEQPVNFTTTFSDPDTWQNIQYVYFLVNTSTSGANCLYAYYNQNTNKLYLRNDANNAWLGGYIPGSNSTIENSYVILNCAQTSVSGAGNNLSLNWSVSFKSNFNGSKNTYLYIKDDTNAYQNWIQKGTWNALSSGKIIGPAGGEVASSDNKVKVIIPQGALSDPTPIGISAVSQQTLQAQVPAGSTLLSLVECQPYGLVFQQPVSIIYTLSQAEVPGTDVELGLYNSVEKKITPTGQHSTVPADGYTLTFSIMHFSTYAALKSLTPQSAPIGAGVKIPLPDLLTGSFSHAIPITIPPGRKGMQPSLALSYRSSNSNSWVGLGFSLNPGYIVRSTRLGPPTYNDTQDTFYFISDAGTTELVWLVDNLYQAKVESSFTKFFKEPDDSWRVVGKDGSVLRFGQASDAKETSSSGTFSWYLTKVLDNNGNYIEYRYTKDQGKCYLSRIDYTGNEIGVAPTNSVEFFLEPREDISSSYISTSKIATARRLKEIQVKQNYDLVWRYVLEYGYSSDTNRSLLRSITQSGSDGKSLPTQNLSYQGAK